MPIVESYPPPGAVYRVGDLYDVYDHDTAAVLDQLLAHIQALTVVSLGLLTPVGLYECYDLPNESASRALLCAKLQEECSLIMQTFSEVAPYTVSAEERARLAHVLREQVPHLGEFAPTADERARQSVFSALVRGERAPAPDPVARQRLTGIVPD